MWLWTLHARLFISAAVGIAVTLALLALPWRMPTRILIGWDIGVVLYLVLSYRAAAHASIVTIRQRAAINDDGAVALLVLATAAVLASLAAVLAELGHAPGWYRVALALHYAHEFYGASGDKHAGGLLFPGKEDSDYWDFLYYSLVVAMTAQVSDVQVTSKSIRRLTSVHGVASFLFQCGRARIDGEYRIQPDAVDRPFGNNVRL